MDTITEKIDLGEKFEIGKQTNKQVVRKKTSYYKSRNGYALKIELLYQKRKSSGFQVLDEEFDSGEAIGDIVNLSDVEDGLYEVIATNFSYDYETGWVDNWDLKLVAYNEEV